MKIKLLQGIEGAKKATGISVIIDVFRAFTVEAYLMNNGAKKIIPVGDIKTAYQYKKDHSQYLLIGERNGKEHSERFIVNKGGVFPPRSAVYMGERNKKSRLLRQPAYAYVGKGTRRRRKRTSRTYFARISGCGSAYGNFHRGNSARGDHRAYNVAPDGICALGQQRPRKTKPYRRQTRAGSENGRGRRSHFHRRKRAGSGGSAARSGRKRAGHSKHIYIRNEKGRRKAGSGGRTQRQSYRFRRGGKGGGAGKLYPSRGRKAPYRIPRRRGA